MIMRSIAFLVRRKGVSSHTTGYVSCRGKGYNVCSSRLAPFGAALRVHELFRPTGAGSCRYEVRQFHVVKYFHGYVVSRCQTRNNGIEREAGDEGLEAPG